MRAAQELRQDFSLTAEPDVLALFRLPGVVSTRSGSPATAMRRNEEDLGRLGRQVTGLPRRCSGTFGENARGGRAITRASEMLLLAASIREKTAQLESLTARSRPAYALRLQQQAAGNCSAVPQISGKLLTPGWRRKRQYLPNAPTSARNWHGCGAMRRSSDQLVANGGRSGRN